MSIRIAVAWIFLLSACAEDKSITAPHPPPAKTLALPTASLAPDPSSFAFMADSTGWYPFAIETTADSLLFEVNPDTLDAVLALSGPDRPEASGCPAEPNGRMAWSAGDSLYVAACGPGRSQIVIKETTYELVLARYEVMVSADTTSAPTEGTLSGSFVDLMGTGLVATPRAETTQEPEEDPTVEEEEDTTPPSDDATLSGLSVSVGTLTPQFDPNRDTYAVSVGASISQITITPTTHDANASAAITLHLGGYKWQKIGTGSAVDLSVGENTIEVNVKAEDGKAKKTYTLIVIRASASTTEQDEPDEPETPSDDATLASLTVSVGTLTPSFDPSIKNYTVSVAHSVEEITITATSNDENAFVNVSEKIGLVWEGFGENVRTFPLAVGENYLGVFVIAQDGQADNLYEVTVTRAAEKKTDDVSNTRTGAKQISIGYPPVGSGDYWSTAVGPFRLTINDVDYFKVVLTEPTDIAIACASWRDDFNFEMDTYGTLYNATGEAVAQNDDFEDLDFVLVALGLPAGTYYLEVYADSGAPGTYTLAVVIDVATSGAGKPTVSSDHLKRKARELLKDGE